jgi:hypothetical protein
LFTDGSGAPGAACALAFGAEVTAPAEIKAINANGAKCPARIFGKRMTISPTPV